MRSPEDSRKRSEQARRQEQDAFGRFCSAIEPAPATSARREKRSAVRAPEASAGRGISFAAHHEAEASAARDRSNAERSLRATVRREKKGCLKKGTIPRSGSGVVAKQKKTTIKLVTSSSEDSSSDESSREEASPGEQLKGKEKKVIS
jgi:hypothetical protein